VVKIMVKIPCPSDQTSPIHDLTHSLGPLLSPLLELIQDTRSILVVWEKMDI
jgi:hypothetical protein